MEIFESYDHRCTAIFFMVHSVYQYLDEEKHACQIVQYKGSPAYKGASIKATYLVLDILKVLQLNRCRHCVFGNKLLVCFSIGILF